MEILMVVDSTADGKLTLRALRKKGIANDVHWVKDGQEALDFLFREGVYAGHSPAHHPGGDAYLQP